MEKFAWDVENGPNTGERFVTIEKRRYIVSDETGVLVHSLMCINDTLEEIHNRLIDLAKKDE